jgi:hypothetical protein
MMHTRYLSWTMDRHELLHSRLRISTAKADYVPIP